MKADITIGSSSKSNIILPGKKNGNTIVYAFPTRDVVVRSYKINQDIYASDYSKSAKIILEIPGATVKMPVIRLRLLGDLPGLTLGNTAGWSLYNLYYVEE